jgi:hypothetical protein
MSRKVYVGVKVRLIINMEEGVSVDDVINEMDYKFSSNNDGADIVDSEIIDFEVTDSK